MMGAIARKESRQVTSPRWSGHLLIEARRVSHYWSLIVLEFELDPDQPSLGHISTLSVEM
jgi:hypothetical protein